jgi:DNA-directed RNA polymerase specialized sigma subunit
MINLPNYNLSGSVDSAEELLNSLFNKDQAKIIAKFINESIDYAESLDSSKVSVSYRKNKKIIRVNVGRLEVVSLSNKGLLVVLDYSLLFDELKEMLEASWQYPEDRPTAYSVLEHSCRIRLDPENLQSFYKIFRKANNDLITKAVKTGKNVWTSADSKDTRKVLDAYSIGNYETTKLEPPKEYLFNEEGKINCDFKEFIKKLSSVVLPTDEENKGALLSLGGLEGKKYNQKVLDIAHRNVRLFRSKLVPLIAEGDLSDDELTLITEEMIGGLMSAIRNFNTSYDYKLSTYAEFVLLQRKTRGISKVIQNRITSKFDITIGLGLIEKGFFEYKKVYGEYPSNKLWVESLMPIIKERISIEGSRKDRKEAKHQKRLGINKLYKKLFETEDLEFEEDSILSDLEEYLTRLTNQEKDIINSRYGISDEVHEYGETLASVGDRYDLTRERIRQLENIAMAKLRFIIKNKDGGNGELPKELFKDKTLVFLKKNQISYIHQLIKLSKQEINYVYGQSKLVLDDLSDFVKLSGFELVEKNDDDVDFEQLSNRSKNVLLKNNLVKIDSLLAINEDSYEYFTGLGEKSINELKNYVKNLKKNSPEIINDGDNEEAIRVKIYSNENLISRVSIDISEDLADDLLMGEVESIAQLIKAVEDELYN